MYFLISDKKFTIPVGMEIINYTDDINSETISSTDDTERSLIEWCEYISTNSSYISSIELYKNEFSYVAVNDITHNPTIRFLNNELSESIGFKYGITYIHNNSIEDGMNIYANSWGIGRYVLENVEGDNFIGTDGNMFQPHQVTGGWTVSGESYRPVNKINTIFWKLTTDGLTQKQGKEAIKFFENVGSNHDFRMYPVCYDVFEKTVFQVLAHDEYLKNDDLVGYYKIDFELSERAGSGLLTLNDDSTYITKNDDITFLVRS